MVINRVCGLALPGSTKILIDDIIGKRRTELLLPLVSAALAVLIRISPLMTGLAVLIIGSFAVVLAKAFRTIRPIFRERGKINAEVTGRLTESLGGVRVIKGYHAEAREEEVFAGGVQRLLDDVIKSLTAMSLMSFAATVLLGFIGAVVMYVGARQILAGALT